MIEQASRDYDDTDQGQRERKQKGILEYHVGKMSEINANPECAEYRVYAPHQDNRQQQQSDIEEAVNRLPRLARAFSRSNAAPKGSQSEQMKPKPKSSSRWL